MLILIAGASGSGKTTLAKECYHRIGAESANLISLDSYYRDLSHLSQLERGKNNFDHPESIEHNLLVKQIGELLNGSTISPPLYDFKTHTRVGYDHPISPKRVLIIEGIYALFWPKIRQLSELKIFIDTPLSLCFERRLERDQRERGRTKESVFEQWEAVAKPMFKEHGAPTKELADLIISDQKLDSAVTTIIGKI